MEGDMEEEGAVTEVVEGEVVLPVTEGEGEELMDRGCRERAEVNCQRIS